MFSCRVLKGPIATDKEYHVDDTVYLNQKDADSLTALGVVEIIGEVEANFVPTPVPIPVTVVAEPVAVAPVAVIPAPVAVPAPVGTPAPVVTEPVIETPVPTQKPELPTPTTEETLELEKAETTPRKTTTDRKKK